MMKLQQMRQNDDEITKFFIGASGHPCSFENTIASADENTEHVRHIQRGTVVPHIEFCVCFHRSMEC